MTTDAEGGSWLAVHGARGSAPVSGPAFARCGGNTTCFATRLADGHHVLFDCGSGLGRMQEELSAARPFEATIFLTHFHWDHLQGLPTFAPLYESSTRLHFVAVPPEGMSIAEALDGVIRPPWFPVRFKDAPAIVTYEPLGEQTVRLGNLEVVGAPLAHPGGVTGYRIESDGRALVLATDVEAEAGTHEASFRSLADGVAVLVHDAQYTPAEYREAKRGWGHSTWEDAARAAVECGASRLVLTSHDTTRTDDQVDALVAAARAIHPATEGAFEGQVIRF